MKSIIAFIASAFMAMPVAAGVIVNPGGNIRGIAGDPARDVFYLTIDTNEVVAVTASGGIASRVSVPGTAGTLAVTPDGTRLFVALLNTHDVAAYSLPALTYSATYNLSGTQTGPTGLAADNRWLYATSEGGLSVYDTLGNVESYFGSPVISSFYDTRLALSPNGRALYALEGTSPAALHVLDVTHDVPVFIGDACCLGGTGQDMTLSPDGALAYVAAVYPDCLQVLGTTPPLVHDKFAGLTGPSPRAVVAARNGSVVYLGYSEIGGGFSGFAAVRTSDWLPFHVGTLQGGMARAGLALSSSQSTLAAVIEYAGYDPNRVELVGVSALPANRGGIRLRPRDNVDNVPINNARISVSEGHSDYVQVRDGVLGRAPLQSGTVNFSLTAPGHDTQSLAANVTAGSWADLGIVTMNRSGSMPDPSEVGASPSLIPGATQDVEIHGRGFIPGLNVAVGLPGITIDSFAFLDWATIGARLTVAPGAPPGRFPIAVLVTNPGGGYAWGSLTVAPGWDRIFEDGFDAN